MAECDPTMGGCWFCHTDDGEMYFTVEWDAFFHRDCLVSIIDETRDTDWKDEEAEIMAREFGLIDAAGHRIYTGALDNEREGPALPLARRRPVDRQDAGGVSQK